MPYIETPNSVLIVASLGNLCFLTREAGNVYSVNIQLNFIVLRLLSCGHAMQQENESRARVGDDNHSNPSPSPQKMLIYVFMRPSCLSTISTPKACIFFCIYVLGRGETNILNCSTHTLDLMGSFS